MKKYVQYGCGYVAPDIWENYDVSPTLRIQKNPLLNMFLKSRLNAIFPKNVRYGDIIKGLPVANSSCDGVYCSHVLEHLSLEDFRITLKNTYGMLKPEGIFRCVVPDLERAAKTYLDELSSGNTEASIKFVDENTSLGFTKRPKGLIELIVSVFGNSHHLWMWDCASLTGELTKAGFNSVRTCSFNDCDDKMFNLVEQYHRFEGSVAIESKK